MIAKVIVRGTDRQDALQKLRTTLENYEIAGPITNIEFLKRLCISSDFAAGDVETGYIEKHRDELFARDPISPEVWAQAALGIMAQEVLPKFHEQALLQPAAILGFGGGYQARLIHLVARSLGPEEPEKAIVQLTQTSSATFNVRVNDTEFDHVQVSLKSQNDIESFFPHKRLASTVIRREDELIVFQQGKQYNLYLETPKWTGKALGTKDVANSVLAPMPCKILRVDVSEGDEVKKDQPLVVIESMKMETVIRSPQNGIVAKVVHRQGVSNQTFTLCNQRSNLRKDICKAGTALVEFVAETVT